jgi:hypothetical protein
MFRAEVRSCEEPRSWLTCGQWPVSCDIQKHGCIEAAVVLRPDP